MRITEALKRTTYMITSVVFCACVGGGLAGAKGLILGILFGMLGWLLAAFEVKNEGDRT